MTENTLILRVGLFLAALANWSFFGQVLKTYAPATTHALPLLSLVVVMVAVTVGLLAVLAVPRATKPMLALVLVASALAAAFMDSYGIVINDEMLQNAAQTNPGEALDLLNPRLLAYLLTLGVLPVYFLWRAKPIWRGWRREIAARAKLLAGVLLAILVPVLVFGGFYASFAREHKNLRTYLNPAYPLYSLARYAREQWATPAREQAIVPVGMDARIPATDKHRELIILVVGETARADHFSLNGYTRETNPRLSALDVINFTDFRACGTSTAVSVPCMFSVNGSQGKATGQEGLLDVLQHAGVHVLWLDNNSDSKGAAARVPYRSYKSPEINTRCDVECRDEGMLVPLQEYIDSWPDGDIVIVLHQMGNHGPAYYKRYPEAFERFTPACRSNDLGQCTREEIVNAYDNALLYTDDFLAKTIELLKKNNERFETAMFYISDHGESLGEAGTYLHGLPLAIAPKAQVHVPAIMWFGDSFDELDREALKRKRDQRFTHDNLFHTMLGFLEIETSIYRPELDILSGCRLPERD